MMIKFVMTELMVRKGDWTKLAKILGVSTKTIHRIAYGTTDPVYSTVERLYLLLKKDKL
jgi:predicted transcriptional regulator